MINKREFSFPLAWPFFVALLWFFPHHLSATTFTIATATSSADGSSLINHISSFGVDQFIFSATPSPGADDYELNFSIFDKDNKLVNHLYSRTATQAITLSLRWDGVGDYDLNPATAYVDNTPAHKLPSGTYKVVATMNERLKFDMSVGFGKAFNQPDDCQCDANGNFVVVNRLDGVVHLLNSSGDIMDRFGSNDDWASPRGCAIDNQGDQAIYVSATAGNAQDGAIAAATMIRKSTRVGGVWTIDVTFEVNQKAAFPFATGATNGPRGLCVAKDATGNEFVYAGGRGSASNERCLTKFNLDGTLKYSYSNTGNVPTEGNGVIEDVAAITVGGTTYVYMVIANTTVYRYTENGAGTAVTTTVPVTYAGDGGSNYVGISVDDNYIYCADTENPGGELNAFNRGTGALLGGPNWPIDYHNDPVANIGLFQDIYGVATDRGRNRIWVCDSLNNNDSIPFYPIIRYDINPSTGSASKTHKIQSDLFALSEPHHIFVDQANGDFYVTDVRLNVAKKFNHQGTFQNEYDAASWTNRVFDDIRGIAVESPAGKVYIGNDDTGEIIRFNNAGGAPIDAWPTAYANGCGNIRQMFIAKYSGQDYLFVADRTNQRIYSFNLSVAPTQAAGVLLSWNFGQAIAGVNVNNEGYLVGVSENRRIYYLRHNGAANADDPNYTDNGLELGFPQIPTGGGGSGVLRACATDYFGDVWIADSDYDIGGTNLSGAIWKASFDGDQPEQKTSDSVTGNRLIRGSNDAAAFDRVKLGYNSTDLGPADGQILNPQGIAVYPNNRYTLSQAGSFNPKYVYVCEGKNGRVSRFRVEADDVKTFYLSLGTKGGVATPTIGNFEVVGYEDLKPYVLSTGGNPYTIRVHFSRRDMDPTVGQGTVTITSASALDYPVTFSKWLGTNQIWEGTVNLPASDDGLADVKIQNFRNSVANRYIGTPPLYTVILNDVINIKNSPPTLNLTTMDGDTLAPPPEVNITDRPTVAIAGTTVPGAMAVTVFNYNHPTLSAPVNLSDSQSLFSDASGNYSANNIDLTSGLNYLTASASDQALNDSGLITPRYIVNRVNKLPGTLTISPTTDRTLGFIGSWTLTYKASSDIGSLSNGLGQAEYLKITLPNGWSPPTVSEGVTGFIKLYPSTSDINRVDLATQTLQIPGTYSLKITGQVLEVYFDRIQSGHGFRVVYGDPADLSPPPNTPAKVIIGDPENQVVLGPNSFNAVLYTATGTIPLTATLASTSLNPASIKVLPRSAKVSVANAISIPLKFNDADIGNDYDNGEEIFYDNNDDYFGGSPDSYLLGTASDAANIKNFLTDNLSAGSISTVFFDANGDGIYQDLADSIVRDLNNNKKMDAAEQPQIRGPAVSNGVGLKPFPAAIYAGQGDIKYLRLTVKNPNPNHSLILRGLYVHVRDRNGAGLNPDNIFDNIVVKDSGGSVRLTANNPFNKTNERVFLDISANNASYTITTSSDAVVDIYGKLKSGLAGGTLFHLGFEANSDFSLKDSTLFVDGTATLDTGMTYGTSSGTMRSFNAMIHKYNTAQKLAVTYDNFWTTGSTNLSKGQTGAKNQALLFHQPVAGEGEIEVLQIKLTTQSTATIPVTKPGNDAPRNLFDKAVVQTPAGSPYKVLNGPLVAIPATLTLDLTSNPIIVDNTATKTVDFLFDIASWTVMTPYIRTNIYNKAQITARDKITLAAIATFTVTTTPFPYLSNAQGFGRIWPTASINCFDVAVVATDGITVLPKANPVNAIIGDKIRVNLIVKHVPGTATATFDSSETDPVDLRIRQGVTDITSQFKVTTITRPGQVGNGAIATFVYELEQIYGSTAGVLTIDSAYGPRGPITYDSNDAVDSQKLVVTDTNGALSPDTRLTVSKAQLDLVKIGILPRNDVSDPPVPPANNDAVSASETNVLVTAFSLFHNNGGATKISNLVWKQTGTVADNHIIRVLLWRDKNANLGDRNFISSGINKDDVAASGTLSGGQIIFNAFKAPYNDIVSGASVAFFISVDIASYSSTRIDGKTLDGEIPVQGVTFDNGFKAETFVVDSMSTATHIVNIRASRLKLVPTSNTAATNSTKTIDLEGQDQYGNRDYDSTKNLIITLSESVMPKTASVTATTLNSPSPAIPPDRTSFNGNLVAGAGQISIKDVTLVNEYVYASITSAFPFASGSIYYQSGVFVSANAVTPGTVPALATATVMDFEIANSSGFVIKMNSITVTSNNDLDADIGTVSLIYQPTQVVIKSLPFTAGDNNFSGLNYSLPMTPSVSRFQIKYFTKRTVVDGDLIDVLINVNKVTFATYTPPTNVPDTVTNSGGNININVPTTKIWVSNTDGTAQINTVERFTIKAGDDYGNKDKDYSSPITITSSGGGADNARINAHTFASVSSGGNGFKNITGTLSTGQSTIDYLDDGVELVSVSSSGAPPGVTNSSANCQWNNLTINGINVFKRLTYPPGTPITWIRSANKSGALAPNYDLLVVASGTTGGVQTGLTVKCDGLANKGVTMWEHPANSGYYFASITFQTSDNTTSSNPYYLTATREQGNIVFESSADTGKTKTIKLYNARTIKIATTSTAITVGAGLSTKNMTVRLVGENNQILSTATLDLNTNTYDVSFFTVNTARGQWNAYTASNPLNLGALTTKWDALSNGSTLTRARFVAPIYGATTSQNITMNVGGPSLTLGTFTIAIRMVGDATFPTPTTFIGLSSATPLFTIVSGARYQIRVTSHYTNGPEANASFSEKLMSSGLSSTTYGYKILPDANFLPAPFGSITFIASFTRKGTIPADQTPIKIRLNCQDLTTTPPNNEASATALVWFVASETAAYGASSTIDANTATVPIGTQYPYFISGWIRQASHTNPIFKGTGKVILGEYDGSWNLIKSSPFSLPHDAGNTLKWWRFSFGPFTLGTGPATEWVTLKVGAATGTVWFDGVQLERGEPGQSIASDWYSGPALVSPSGKKSVSGEQLNKF